LFCSSCITEWNKRGNKTCPVCQVQPIYKENYDLKCKIDSKYVRCETSLCSWKGRLERLTHHVHETTMEVDRVHQQKKRVLIRRIKRIEKNKRHDALERENAQTLPIESTESTLSRTDLHRPLRDGFERDSPYKLPLIQWQQPPVHKDSIYHRLEHVKQEKR